MLDCDTLELLCPMLIDVLERSRTRDNQQEETDDMSEERKMRSWMSLAFDDHDLGSHHGRTLALAIDHCPRTRVLSCFQRFIKLTYLVPF